MNYILMNGCLPRGMPGGLSDLNSVADELKITSVYVTKLELK